MLTAYPINMGLISLHPGFAALRRAAAALLRAESRFKRVRGYSEIPRLLVTMQQKSIDKKEAAA